MLTYELIKMGVGLWPHFLTLFLFTIMATYLTEVWKLSVTHAALIINVYSGTVAILTVVIKLTADAFKIGNYWMVLISRLAFTAGLVLLTLSARFSATGTSQVENIMFYTALPSLAIAVSVHETSQGKFMAQTVKKLVAERSEQPILEGLHSETDPEQINPETSDNEDLDEAVSCLFNLCSFCSCKCFLVMILVFFLIPVGMVSALGYIDPWWIKFVIPTIVAGLSLILFFIDDGATAAPSHPRAPNSSFKLTDTNRMGYLYLLLVCIHSILLSLVSTIGNTFFILQAADLNPYLGSLKITDIYLPVIKELAKKHCHKMLTCCGSTPILGMIISIIYATLCCITAAKVETRRLGVVNSHGFVDDPMAIIPMTIFWLVPQYVLLGFAESSSETHLTEAFTSLGPRFKAESIAHISQVVTGVGFFCGVLSVYIVGETKPSWFQYTLNTSRLDNYYWVLAALSAANLFLFVLEIAVFCCTTKDS